MKSPIVEASIERSTDLKESHGGSCKKTLSDTRNSWRLSGSKSGELLSKGYLFDKSLSMLMQFPYDEAYSRLLHQVSIIPSPMGKLTILHELVQLVVFSLSSQQSQHYDKTAHGHQISLSQCSNELASQTSITPRMSLIETTKSRSGSNSAKTPLAEAIATVEAKRMSSGSFLSPGFVTGQDEGPYRGLASVPNTDAIAEELRRVFKSSRVQCSTLFRDLQFIAAFVPCQVLDLTDMGKAFWDVSLAALSLKKEYLKVVTETALELFKYSTSMVSPEMDVLFFSQWNLEDCAWLWSIAAKEGAAEGERELAIMYLSHPDVVPICLSPFSKISETFTAAALENSKSQKDSEKIDPVRMSVVKHWMKSAAVNGDSIASEYLSQQGLSTL